MAFDRALVAAAFELGAERGWARVTVGEAARRAGLKLDEARARFPGRNAILMRFGRLADMAALAEAPADAGNTDGSARDRLFDMVMRRIDVLQAHRDGVLALLRYLRTDPGTALLLTCATQRSMAWLLDGAGISTTGLGGALRTKGLLAVWLWTVRAWQGDESADLSATMAALDQALRRAEQAERMLPARRAASPAADPEATPEPPAASDETAVHSNAPDLPSTSPPPPPEAPASPPV